MRFLSNFGCKIVFMRSVNFCHQQDSKSFFLGSNGCVTSSSLLAEVSHDEARERPLLAEVYYLTAGNLSQANQRAHLPSQLFCISYLFLLLVTL